MNNLHLSDEAQADLAGIKSYIAKNLENPSAAISTVRNITKDIRRLREHSLIGASLSSIADVESDYRFLVTGSYLTFYRVLDNDIYVDRGSTAAGIIFASSLEMCRTTKQTNRDNLLHREKRFVTGTVCRDAGGFSMAGISKSGPQYKDKILPADDNFLKIVVVGGGYWAEVRVLCVADKGGGTHARHTGKSVLWKHHPQ